MQRWWTLHCGYFRAMKLLARCYQTAAISLVASRARSCVIFHEKSFRWAWKNWSTALKISSLRTPRTLYCNQQIRELPWHIDIWTPRTLSCNQPIRELPWRLDSEWWDFQCRGSVFPGPLATVLYPAYKTHGLRLRPFVFCNRPVYVTKWYL